MISQANESLTEQQINRFNAILCAEDILVQIIKLDYAHKFNPNAESEILETCYEIFCEVHNISQLSVVRHLIKQSQLHANSKRSTGESNHET